MSTVEQQRTMLVLIGLPREGAPLSVLEERIRQDEKWGQQDHRDGTGYAYEANRERCRRACQQAFGENVGTWADVLLEEVYEALAETDPVKLREELIQTAAVCVSWIEAIDRRQA